MGLDFENLYGSNIFGHTARKVPRIAAVALLPHLLIASRVHDDYGVPA
jgi:hypothetical protein